MKDVNSKERLEVLKMIEQGKVSPEEGLKLIEALNSDFDSTISKRRVVRIKLLDTENNAKVDFKIPSNFIKMLANFVSKFTDRIDFKKAKDFDIDNFIKLINSGFTGKVFSAQSDDGKEQIEIYVE